MSNPTIIGLGNKARHGKDSAAQAIIDAYGSKYSIVKVPFAGALKAEVDELDQFAECLKHGLVYDYEPPMLDPLCKTRHGKQSALLQFWGQKRRKEDQYYWVKKVHKQIEELDAQFVLIPDLRYVNEYLYIKSRKGYTMRCTRQGFVDFSRDPNHISEVELDGVKMDYEISVVDGDVAELQKDAVIVFEMILAELTPAVPNLEELLATV